MQFQSGATDQWKRRLAASVGDDRSGGPLLLLLTALRWAEPATCCGGVGLDAAKVMEEALLLPAAERAALVQKLLQSLVKDPDKSLEREILVEVHSRRGDARRQLTELIDGDEALRRARAALRR